MQCYICGKNPENRLGPLVIDEIRQVFCPASSGTVYDLGNGDTTQDVGVAVKKFICREYPELENEDSGAIFIPEYFLSQYPNVLEFDATDVHDAMKIGDKNRPKKDKFFNECQVKGEVCESRTFQQLTEVVDNETDMVVFHSYNWVTESTEKQKGEMDFLIVSLRTKTIINIECKSNLNTPKLNKALDQLKKHYNFLTSTLSFGPGWQFVRVLSFMEDSRRLCDTCKKYFIGPSSTFAAVWTNILEISSGTDITPQLKHEYYTHVSQLAFTLSLNFPEGPGAKKSIANDKLLANLESISHPENIILWTRGQLAIYASETQKKVLLTSHFGTGKTVLLKAKALETAKKDKDKLVFYITFPMANEYVNVGQFYRADVKQFGKDQDNLKVLSWFDLKEDVRKNMDKDEQWFEDKEQVFRTFVNIHVEHMAGIFVDEFYNKFFYGDGFEKLSQYKMFSDETIQTLKELLDSSDEEERTIIYDIVSMFLKEHPELFNPDDLEMPAFTSAGQPVVNKITTLWSLLSKILQEWNNNMVNDTGQVLEQKTISQMFSIIMKPFFRPDTDSYQKFSGSYGPQRVLATFSLLKHLSSLKNYSGLIWIATNSEDPIVRTKLLSQDVTGFCVPTLKYNMRSVYNIAHYISTVDSGIKYTKPSNAILGRKPIVPFCIDVWSEIDKKAAAELFRTFKIALKALDNDTNDVLVVFWNYFVETKIQLIEMALVRLIQEYCLKKEIPCCNCTDEEQSKKDMETFLNNGRKGIVLGDMVSAQGFEFKSVILFTHLQLHNVVSSNLNITKSSRNHCSDVNAMLRARINLYVIRYRLKKREPLLTRLANFFRSLYEYFDE